MIRIGVIVEGPSDQTFWSKLLWRSFPGFHWDVRALHGRNKVFRGAANLVDGFIAIETPAILILVDNDDALCVTAIRDQFAGSISDHFSSPAPTRRVHLFIARKELESWFLADEESIRFLTGCQEYNAPIETDSTASKKKLRELLQVSGSPGRVFNEIDFAKQIGSIFKPEAAKMHSKSFAYFWNRLQAVTTTFRS